jgi:hypothetical protein
VRTEVEEFWLDLILRLGFPIVVVLAMIKGHIVPGFIYERVVKENERLTQVAEEKVIPLAVEGQRLLREALAILEEREFTEDEDQPPHQIPPPPPPPPRRGTVRR